MGSSYYSQKREIGYSRRGFCFASDTNLTLHTLLHCMPELYHLYWAAKAKHTLAKHISRACGLYVCWTKLTEETY